MSKNGGICECEVACEEIWGMTCVYHTQTVENKIEVGWKGM